MQSSIVWLGKVLTVHLPAHITYRACKSVASRLCYGRSSNGGFSSQVSWNHRRYSRGTKTWKQQTTIQPVFAESSHTSRCQQLNFNTQNVRPWFRIGPRQVHAVYKMYACRAIYTLVQHGVWHLSQAYLRYTDAIQTLYRRYMHFIGRLDGGRAWQLLQWTIFQTVFSTCNVASLAFCLQWVERL